MRALIFLLLCFTSSFGQSETNFKASAKTSSITQEKLDKNGFTKLSIAAMGNKKIEDDHASGKLFDDISKKLEKIGIKPRGRGLWFTRRIVQTLKENRLMWVAFKNNKTLLFEKGRMAPGLR